MGQVNLFTKMSWVVIMLFFGLGCAVMSQPDTEEPQKIDLPPKANVDIPQALNPESNLGLLEKIKVEKQTGYARGYENLVNYIDFVEYIIEQVKLMIPLFDASMLEIQKACQGTKINEVCRIDSGKVSVVFDDALLSTLRSLLQVDPQMSNRLVLGEAIEYGDIEFAQYDNTHTYNYKLSIDITAFEALVYDLNLSNSKSLHVIEWSDDNNTVLSSRYSGEGDNFKKVWTISYQNKSTKERMHLYDMEFDDEPNPHYVNQYTNTFTLTKLFDLNKTYYAKYNSITNPFSFFEGRTAYKFSSYTKLTNTIGYQRYVTSEPFLSGDPLYREDSVFDNFGRLLAVTYCDEADESCRIEDKESWYSDAEDERVFDPIDKLPVAFIPLKIRGGNLRKEGSYFLLPKGVNIKEMGIDEVVVKSVGEFIYAYDATQGILYDDTYSDTLETLQLVYSKYNDEVGLSLAKHDEVAFEVVNNQDRPTIELALPKP